MKSTKLQFADALRGLAILGVLLVHVSQKAPGLPSILGKLFSLGGNGVQLFYIVSAFTLFYSLSLRSTGENESFFKFMIRRFFRISPLFYFALIVYLLVDGTGARYWLGYHSKISIGNVISHLFFINGWNPYWINSILGVEWSIAVEMMFYLCVPFLFAKIKKLSSAVLLTVGITVICYVLNSQLEKHPFISDPNLWHYYLSWYPPTQFPIFGFGVILFFLWKNYSTKLNGQFKVAFSLLIGSFLFLGISVLLKGDNLFLIGLSFTLFSFSLSLYKFKMLVNSFWSFIGKISFSMYLTHFLILEKINVILIKFIGNSMNPLFKFPILFLLTFGITVLISTITYYFIEKQGIDLGRKLISKISSKTISKAKRIA